MNGGPVVPGGPPQRTCGPRQGGKLVGTGTFGYSVGLSGDHRGWTFRRQQWSGMGVQALGKRMDPTGQQIEGFRCVRMQRRVVRWRCRLTATRPSWAEALTTP